MADEYEVVWNGAIDRQYTEHRRRKAPETRRGESTVVVGPSGAVLKGLETERACEAAGCWHQAKAQMYYSTGRRGPLYCWSCGDRALVQAAKMTKAMRHEAE